MDSHQKYVKYETAAGYPLLFVICAKYDDDDDDTGCESGKLHQSLYFDDCTIRIYLRSQYNMIFLIQYIKCTELKVIRRIKTYYEDD